MEARCKHLTPVDFSRFIERNLEGWTWGPVKQHLTECPECLRRLGQILRGGAPAMPEDEPILGTQTGAIRR